MSFGPERFSYSILSPEIIAGNASNRLRQKTIPMSSKTAIALAMVDLGSDRLKSMPAFIQRSGYAVANVDANSESDEEKLEFFRSYGSVFFGSIVLALEHGAVNGWSDDFFVETLNLDMGYHFGKFTQNDFSVGVHPLERFTPREVAQNIRNVLRKDGNTFAGFFEPNFDNLPEGLKVFLCSHSTYEALTKFGFSIYKDVLKHIDK